ncbi:hypothetical protein MAR_037353, partial [Mya arenaria]
MKGFVNKVKTLFNKKEDNSRESWLFTKAGFIDTKVKMASIATRDARRLPSVPGKTRGQRILVPTYRHAVNWFNKNRETLDLITGLLEVHPSLIYQEPCTKLRNFLSAVHTDTSTRISDVFRHSDINDQHQVNSSILNGSETQKSMSVSNVPEILVSKPEDENSSLSDPCSTQR